MKFLDVTASRDIDLSFGVGYKLQLSNKNKILDFHQTCALQTYNVTSLRSKVSDFYNLIYNSNSM